MKNPIQRFLLRWFVSSLGLWFASLLLSDGAISFQDRLSVIVISGLVLALINAVIKPIVVILSLPAILFSLGLFMIIINGLMVLLASTLYDKLMVENFWAAMLAGMVIGLVNYLVTAILEDNDE